MVKVTHEPDLTTQSGRLRHARMRKYSSMRGAANAFGWNENTYKSHEQGIRRDGALTEDDAKRYARAFGVSAGWLMTGKGDAISRDSLTPPRRQAPAPLPDRRPAQETSFAIPIISFVAAGALTDPSTQIGGDHQTIEISGLEPGDYFATRVHGTSMDRISPSGSLIVVNRAERELVRGRRYIFARGGDTTYKRYERDPVRLEPETTDPDTNRTIFPRDEEQWDVVGRVRLTLMDDL